MQSLAVFPTTGLNYEFCAVTREEPYHWLGIAQCLTQPKEHVRNHQEVQMVQPGSQDTVLWVFTRLPESSVGVGTKPQDQAFHVC